MLVVDANVLLYAVNERSDEHAVASGWLRGALGGREVVAFAWTVVIAFLRISTHRAVFPRPLTPGTAARIVERWLESPRTVTVEPTVRHMALLRSLLDAAGTGGNLVGDAHLAALALERGGTVVSFDRDFARFEGLSVLRPG